MLYRASQTLQQAHISLPQDILVFLSTVLRVAMQDADELEKGTWAFRVKDINQKTRRDITQFAETKRANLGQPREKKYLTMKTNQKSKCTSVVQSAGLMQQVVNIYRPVPPLHAAPKRVAIGGNA